LCAPQIAECFSNTITWQQILTLRTWKRQSYVHRQRISAFIYLEETSNVNSQDKRMSGFAYLEETIDMDRQMIKIGKHIKWLTETSSISRKNDQPK
jgi:hypothetical protein